MIYLRSILVLYSHLRPGLRSGLLLSGPPADILYAPPLSSIRATNPVHLILLDFITRIIFGEETDGTVYRGALFSSPLPPRPP